MNAILLTTIPIVIPSAILVTLYPRRHTDFAARCECLIARIIPKRYANLLEILESYSLQDDGVFWSSIRELHGIWECLTETWKFFLIVQCHVAEHAISYADAKWIWVRCALQLVFSFRALIEAGICRVIPVWPHVSARTALMIHLDILQRVENLISTPLSPAARLHEVL